MVPSGYALSLWSRYYDYRQHPPFRDYGRGVMASPHTPEKMRADWQMRRLLPPRELAGIDECLCWCQIRPLYISVGHERLLDTILISLAWPHAALRARSLRSRGLRL